MTIAKAKMYKTAQFIGGSWEVPEGFTVGEFVSVSFLYETWGQHIFQCTNVAGQVAAIGEFELDRFVL